MYEYRAIVRRVVDGDTIDVDIDLGFGIWQHNTRVRLAGIDTPEIRTRDPREKKYGYLAKSFVEKFCPVDSHIIIRTFIDSDDKFGRVLGDIFFGEDQSINEMLINERYAVPYEGQSKQDIQEAQEANFQYLDRIFNTPDTI